MSDGVAAMPNDSVAGAYDWSGLRSRRVLLVLALLLVFPGSCIALAIADNVLGMFIPLAVLAVSLRLIQRWQCPRCKAAFSARSSFPWVAPLSTRCGSCGLPDFTSSAEVAPPPAPDVNVTRRVLTAEQMERKKLRNRRMRVALVFVLPLLYLSMCRLPAGAPVRTVGGHMVRVLGLTRWTQWTVGGGKETSLVLIYYRPADDVSLDELLALALPAVRRTGDSTVQLQSTRGDWWARGLGLRISYTSRYRLRADGSWTQ